MCNKVKLICAFVLVCLIGGCAHVETGLKVAQRGLAVVDVATDKAAAEYIRIVLALREYCSSQPKPKTCEARMRVSDEEVARVCVFGPEGPAAGCEAGAAKAMSDAYAKTAEGLSGMEQAWRELRNSLEAVRAAQKAASDGVAS